MSILKTKTMHNLRIIALKNVDPIQDFLNFVILRMSIQLIRIMNT